MRHFSLYLALPSPSSERRRSEEEAHIQSSSPSLSLSLSRARARETRKDGGKKKKKKTHGREPRPRRRDRPELRPRQARSPQEGQIQKGDEHGLGGVGPQIPELGGRTGPRRRSGAAAAARGASPPGVGWGRGRRRCGRSQSIGGAAAFFHASAPAAPLCACSSLNSRHARREDRAFLQSQLEEQKAASPPVSGERKKGKWKVSSRSLAQTSEKETVSVFPFSSF